MQATNAQDEQKKTEEMILRIKNGEDGLRDVLIQDNWKHIMYLVSKMTGKVAYDSYEFSVALQAFNEAIDTYDTAKNAGFSSFSNLVVNRRIIDYMRSMGKYKNEYPETYFEKDGESKVLDIPDQAQQIQLRDVEIQEEILKFSRDLQSFGISYPDLDRISPKHKETRLLCASMAKMLIDSTQLTDRLLAGRRLPVAELCAYFNLSRKTVERHRKYIITLCLVMVSDMEVIKSYLESFLKGETR